ncbi:hypothetical protein [Streptomyces sp. RFCAC02]|uniref:hypothetical protein n=1 Tax=Streptomyces sp. RFCAC02 TaxID=2499143 RepID=UPI00101EE110|nr:hypothetical protein [Streptomyces sp. RFCAC02]
MEQTPVNDFTDPVRDLRQLAVDFDALCYRVRNLTITPATDALDVISPPLQDVQQATGRLLAQLRTLATSPYTTVPGSQETLDALASVTVSAALAGADLAAALADNPCHATPHGPASDETAARVARHKKTAPSVAGYLADAADQLALCATAIQYTAAAVHQATSTTATTTASHRATDLSPPARLTEPQYTALNAIARGGARLRETGRPGTARVSTADGTRITQATLRALETRSLIRVDNRTSLYEGKSIALTTEGRRALDHHRAAPANTTALTPAASALRPRAGRAQ